MGQFKNQATEIAKLLKNEMPNVHFALEEASDTYIHFVAYGVSFSDFVENVLISLEYINDSNINHGISCLVNFGPVVETPALYKLIYDYNNTLLFARMTVDNGQLKAVFYLTELFTAETAIKYFFVFLSNITCQISKKLFEPMRPLLKN